MAELRREPFMAAVTDLGRLPHAEEYSQTA
jgi:hypothetical protein